MKYLLDPRPPLSLGLVCCVLGSAAFSQVSFTEAAPAVGWVALAALPGAAPRAWSVTFSDAEPDTAYAGSSAGLLISLDQGTSWSLQSPWPRDHAGYGIVAASPADPGTIVGAIGLSGVWRTTDRGLTWVQPTVPPDEGFLVDVRFAPGCASVVFVQGFGQFLWRSVDGGDHFHPFFDAGPGGSVSGFDVAEGNPFHVVVHSGGNVWITRDGGLNWLRRAAPAGAIGPILLDPFDPTRMLVLGFGNLFRSDDEGATWTESGVAPTGSIAFDAFEWDRGVPGAIHLGARGLGVYRSGDAGQTWSLIGGPGLDRSSARPYDLATSPARPGRVLLGEAGGLFTSSDGGLSYSNRNAGLGEHAWITGVAADPTDRNRIVAASGGTVATSADGGATWTPSALAPRTHPQPVRADPTTPGRFYLTDTAVGLHRSDDGGLTFDLVFEQPGVYFWNVAPHPTTPGRVFGAGAGLCRSDDSGATFSGNLVGAGWVWAVEISPVDPDVMFCSTGSTVLRSLDGGLSFQPALTSPPAVVRTLQADPYDANVVYGTSDGSGAWKSEDAGLHWYRLPESRRSESGLAPLPGLPGGWISGLGASQNARISLDDGMTFRTLRSALGSSASVLSSTPSDVFLGTSGSGIFRLASRR
ncbi:BNR/Asp-box repeat protein [Planctomycetes bacterium Poly30]|uniref:BNR/Asp-box repeat protein n=1 Tax=Saltatorellus ferox TaxID=2528018 RepID=A0A518EPK6_9BACT|nr:BNR/Asp-box repeat protein [Planctomycetes bacterium Poly30]